jgi:AraC family transcriptional regulator of adaptative response / DNA-3-methyladenine glycosylase II
VLTDDARYAALLTRDRRFDGLFFVGVSTTGIYCRPICPARTPGRTRCTFYPTAANAEAAGFRACFRCRPELAPGNAEVDAVDALVATVARRITEGALNDASVDDLAAQLGVSARHLRRATEARLGVSPVELAQTRRLALAKQLLQDTALPLTEIAFAAGFGSVRRFNAAFIERMGKAPSVLRRTHVAEPLSGLTLRLDYRPPYAWREILAFFRMRAVPGVEIVDADSYRRVTRIGALVGTITVRQAPARDSLLLGVSASLIPALMPLVAHVRRMFDLDARPDVIARVLGADATLAPLVRARPGLRLPGAIDPFEASVRALLGQQVSVAAATTLAGRFAAAFGTPHDGGDLTRVFPTAAQVAAVTPDAIAKIGLPGARAAALHGFARALASGALVLGGELDAFVAAAVALPGIGPWTANYLAMRALHLPDAFPAADLGIKKALDATPREAEARAQAWRPFRSYAVMQLWTSLGGTNGDDANDVIPARRAAPLRARGRADRRVPAGAARARRDRGKVRRAGPRSSAEGGEKVDRAEARARRDGRAAPRVLRR